MDLERFFDRVNHDILMDRLAQTPKVIANWTSGCDTGYVPCS
ncbi:MAG: hypothetical protein ACK4ZD_14890 [Caldimonas sp.]